MYDNQMNRKVTINTDGTAGPYILIGVDQLDDLRQLLNEIGISHSADPDAITQDGEPASALVNLGHGADVDQIQSILDSVE